MAKLYNKETHEVYWSGGDILAAVEENYWELLDFMNAKKLDGHDMKDQWYMLVCAKLDELIDALNENPTNELDPHITEIL